MLDLTTLKIGFLGFGNMAQAMAQGLLYKAAVKPAQIFACAQNWDKLCRNTTAHGMQPCKSAAELVESADLIVIAVKPYLVEQVVAPIRDALQHKIVVSVAVNMDFATYEQILPAGTHHISTLPNTPVSIGEGIMLYENKHSLTAEEFAIFQQLWGTLGLLQEVDVKQMGVAGIVSGCGPAFASMFIEALADGAVLHGLPRTTAYQLASQMLAGTGKLQLASAQHPGAMKDAVCSPGGTTIVGVATLERKGLRTAVIDAIDAIAKK